MAPYRSATRGRKRRTWALRLKGAHGPPTLIIGPLQIRHEGHFKQPGLRILDAPEVWAQVPDQLQGSSASPSSLDMGVRARLRPPSLKRQGPHKLLELAPEFRPASLCASMSCKLLPRQPATRTQLLYPYSKRRLLGVCEPIPSGLQWPGSHSLRKTSCL